MTLRDEDTGIEITLNYDEDGFPLIGIHTSDGFHANQRPTVDVAMNGVCIHEMFDEADSRWQLQENPC